MVEQGIDKKQSLGGTVTTYTPVVKYETTSSCCDEAKKRVLVVPRSLLEKEGPLFQGFCYDVERWSRRILGNRCSGFVSRTLAEIDPMLKQIVPYALMRCGRSFISYRRGKAGGEVRLVGKRALGIGGHVNPEDSGQNPVIDISCACQNALLREVAEEVGVGCSYKDKIVGFLNDDSNDVGQVHLGVVHVWSLAHFNVYVREKAIEDLSFFSASHLGGMSEDFEGWSKLLLPYLESF